MKSALPDNAFLACINQRKYKNGRIEISCKLGLWSVVGKDRDRVHRIAAQYWVQYYEDGEYASLLKQGKDPNGSIEKQQSPH